MTLHENALRWGLIGPLLLTGMLGCEGCIEEPWPEPVAPPAKYLTVVPGEIHIRIGDPRARERVNVIAFVQDEYGRNLVDHTTTFTAASGGAPFEIDPIGAWGDSVALVVTPACTTDGACTPADFDGTLTATHPASGLTLDVPVHVRYASAGDHGVAAAPLGAPWPMYGIASAQVGGAWKPRMMRAFVRRVGFAKFDAGATVPANDAVSGAILSSEYAFHRKTDPWGATPGDLTAPAGTPGAPITIPLRALYAGDPALFPSVEGAYRIALEGGADLIRRTPLGVSVALQAGIQQMTRIAGTSNCADFGTALSAVPPVEQVNPGELTIYMLDVGTLGTAQRAVHCPPGTLTGLPAAEAILVPFGSANAPSVAHEIGHALGLHHVTFGSGFFEDNLMVETDELSAPMRSRLTLGQVYRASVGSASFLVRSGRARWPSLDCIALAPQCPGEADDAARRTP